MGKVTGTSMIPTTVGLFFFVNFFLFKNSESLRLILLFPYLQKKEQRAEVQFSYMYSSQRGSRPCSRKH